MFFIFFFFWNPLRFNQAEIDHLSTARNVTLSTKAKYNWSYLQDTSTASWDGRKWTSLPEFQYKSKGRMELTVCWGVRQMKVQKFPLLLSVEGAGFLGRRLLRRKTSQFPVKSDCLNSLPFLSLAELPQPVFPSCSSMDFKLTPQWWFSVSQS